RSDAPRSPLPAPRSPLSASRSPLAESLTPAASPPGAAHRGAGPGDEALEEPAVLLPGEAGPGEAGAALPLPDDLPLHLLRGAVELIFQDEPHARPRLQRLVHDQADAAPADVVDGRRQPAHPDGRALRARVAAPVRALRPQA